jgi:hypothetical protein
MLIDISIWVLLFNLDFLVTVKTVAQSASRAFGLLIAKSKSLGSLPYNVFTKLYDTIVCPVISYSAPLWEHGHIYVLKRFIIGHSDSFLVLASTQQMLGCW